MPPASEGRAGDIVARTEALLASRPSRPPDHAAEAHALLLLADEMADRPGHVLAALCERIMDLLGCGSAGVSLLRGGEPGGPVFWWAAIAGAWSGYAGGTMPRHASPCGEVIDLRASLIYRDDDLHFAAEQPLHPPPVELLLCPFFEAGKPIGTVWAVAHDDRAFDAEHRRLLASLARFAAAANHALRADDDLRDSQERLDLTLDNAATVALWDWRIAEDRVVADRRFARLFGLDPAEAAAGLPIASFLAAIHPDDRDRVASEIDASLTTGVPFASEYRLSTARGGRRTVLARGTCQRDADGTPLRFPGVAVDITDQRRAESALQESEARYRTLFNSIEAGFCVIEMIFDAAGTAADYLFVEVNPAFVRQSGLQNAAGRTIRQLAPTIEEYWFAIYADIARTGTPMRFESHSPSLGGRWFDVHAFRTGSPDQHRVAIVFTDVTDRRRMEDALRASEQQFRTLAQALPNHVWTARADGMLDWFNEQVYAYTGAAENTLDGEAWAGVVHPDDVNAAALRWAEALADGTHYETEFRLRRHDGVWRWHIARAVPVTDPHGRATRWIGTNTDIDDQKAAAAALADLNATLEARVEERTAELMAAEETLRQAQKMEAVGQLTGGIAHDFNNLLTGIIGALHLTKRRLDAGRSDDVPKFMEAAITSAHRAAGLTHRLLAFARRQSLDSRPQDVAALVAGMEDMLRRTLGENVRLATRMPPDLWPAMTDANQLENAILNLAINARDAMPDGGNLTIEARNIRLDATDARSDDTVIPGDYVEIAVSDTGIGMPADVIAKAFDPFFTTKPIGQGTGLGLSMVYGFLKQSGGHVRISSEPGQGTGVKLFLPRAQAATAATAPDAAPVPHGQGESVLIVEDDETVRLLMTQVLDDLGYRYFAAADAGAAIPILESAIPLDLMVTDVGLPHMNGRQLAEIARARRPGLKILFVTGYARNAAVRGGFLDPGMEMMTKPFALDALAATVRRMIEA